MTCKFIILAALAATVSAQYYHHYAEEDHHAPAEYKFEYSVHDDHTGDIKSQSEERHGDSVKGQYSLIDADGYRRVVDYSSDKHTGFNAVVRREPIKGHHVVVAAPKKIVQYVKPALVHHVQPVQHVEYHHHVAPQVRHVTIPQVHHVQPVIATAYTSHQAQSHTSFNSGKIAYQY
ncbi:hypothetical protein pipiens_002668 [Culex pipiens pipiens]|uniref:Pupal cuticle protein n=1 Tax=Culex pipiens pipiens TaxID=38569 RepID=A0ABD1D9W6_CULPP